MLEQEKFVPGAEAWIAEPSGGDIEDVTAKDEGAQAEDSKAQQTDKENGVPW